MHLSFYAEIRLSSVSKEDDDDNREREKMESFQWREGRRRGENTFRPLLQRENKTSDELYGKRIHTIT